VSTADGMDMVLILIEISRHWRLRATCKMAEGYKWTTGHLEVAECYKWPSGHQENGGEPQVTYGPLGKWRRATSDLWATWKWRNATSDLRAIWKMAESHKWPTDHLENGGGLRVIYGPLGKWRNATSDQRSTRKMAESHKWTMGRMIHNSAI
jgi:hypothetical protein